ncbi:hypothetical protein [Thauera sinica]|uniref:Uncharacterized protein n=1 Tax=Thauera sinica TaxID=2665146 RepID=A0ABW1AR15_9RHOO
MTNPRENCPLPLAERMRIASAWVLWWAMLSSFSLVSAFLVGITIFYLVGGLDLLSAVWHRKEEGNFLWVIAASAAGVPAGAIFGVSLWASLMRRTHWIDADRVKRMSGF